MPEILNKPEPEETILLVTDGIETPINTVEQLREYIQFLLRTDGQQQWTTDKTPDDWISFPIFDEEAFTFGDKDSRRGLADILSDAVTVILAGEDTPLEDDMIENYLYVFTLEKAGDEGDATNDPFTLDERDFVIEKFIESPYADLIALACHCDDESGHEKMHGVFVWIPGKINRIMSVLQNSEDEESYSEDGATESDNNAKDKTDAVDSNNDTENNNELNAGIDGASKKRKDPFKHHD